MFLYSVKLFTVGRVSRDFAQVRVDIINSNIIWVIVQYRFYLQTKVIVISYYQPLSWILLCFSSTSQEIKQCWDLLSFHSFLF